ncbi:MAG: biopolymer transporter ExbD [Bacteroidia bacterium]|nr:biopolymer transporter ExbD [Bacteroidia bacterium]
MAKKPKRGAPTIDMTAMVDVAFLLLTFFILTTTRFREEQKVEVDSPSSVSNIEVPDKQLCVISVDKEGHVYVGFTDITTRQGVLQRYAEEKKVTLSANALAYFSNLAEFGVPQNEIATWLSKEGEELEKYPHAGISARVTDSTTMTGNELKDWIRWGRITDQRMRFAIKGDMSSKYPAVQDVMNSLQEWDVNQFSLITDTEGDGKSEAAEPAGKK